MDFIKGLPFGFLVFVSSASAPMLDHKKAKFSDVLTSTFQFYGFFAH